MDYDDHIKKYQQEMQKLQGDKASVEGQLNQVNDQLGHVEAESQAKSNAPSPSGGPNAPTGPDGQPVQPSQEAPAARQGDGNSAKVAELSSQQASLQGQLGEIKVEYLSAEKARDAWTNAKSQSENAAKSNPNGPPTPNPPPGAPGGGQGGPDGKGASEDRRLQDKHLVESGKQIENQVGEMLKKQENIKQGNELGKTFTSTDMPTQDQHGTPQIKASPVDGAVLGAVIVGGHAVKQMAQGGVPKAYQNNEKPGQGALEPHDLAHDEADAYNLKQSPEFSKKPFEEQAKEMNDLFKQQDNFRNADWDFREGKVAREFKQAATDDPKNKLTYEQDHAQLWKQMEGQRAAEDQKAQGQRSDVVQELCHDGAMRQKDQAVQEKMATYDERLKQMNKEANPKVRENAQLIYDMKESEKVPAKTAELQQQHFPDVPSPSKAAPSVSGPAMQAPAMAGPTLTGPGGGGPGGR